MLCLTFCLFFYLLPYNSSSEIVAFIIVMQRVLNVVILSLISRARNASTIYLSAFALLLLVCGASVLETRASTPWSTRLDGEVRFYQSTEVGVLLVGTEKSLYGLDAETGDVLWRRKDTRLDETDVAAIPGTDLVL